MTRLRRGLATFGALACGAAVALSAAAMHALDGRAATLAGFAAAFSFAHGLALLALAPAATTRLRHVALAAIATGMALFAGALAAAAFFDTSTAVAPTGGVLSMLGWLLLAVDAANG